MDFYSLARRDLQAPLVHIMGEIKGNDAYEEELIDYEEEDEKAHDSIAAKSGGDAVKKGYIGIHSSGFRDFLLKPELLRAIVDSGFEHPSEVQHECIPQGILGMDVICQAKFAVKAGKPWVLDPVAAEASTFCLAACLDLVELKPDVIRGNGSEILALFQASVGSTKNVDSIHDSMDAIVAAKSLVEASGCIVAVSGAVDIVTDGKRVVGARNGVAMLQKKITATGCSVSALIAVFVVVDQFMPLKPQLLHFLYLVWLLRCQWTFCIWFLVIQPVC